MAEKDWSVVRSKKRNVLDNKGVQEAYPKNITTDNSSNNHRISPPLGKPAGNTSAEVSHRTQNRWDGSKTRSAEFKNKSFNSSGGTYKKLNNSGERKKNFQQKELANSNDEISKLNKKKEIRKKLAANLKDFNSQEEEEKFTLLKTQIPHLLMPKNVREIQILENIDGFEDKLLSDEWIGYQEEGWIYVKVIKPEEADTIVDSDEEYKYEIFPLENKWGDYILFKSQLTK